MIFNVSFIINCNYSKYLEKYWNIELCVAVFKTPTLYTLHNIVLSIVGSMKSINKKIKTKVFNTDNANITCALLKKD